MSNQPQKSQQNNGISGKNILSGTSPISPDEQKQYVTKSKSTKKETPGRLTEAENKIKDNEKRIKRIRFSITKMMFLILVLSVILAAYKAGSLVHLGINIENIIELLLAMLLGFLGVNTTYQYTKEHPEKNNIIENVSRYIIDKNKDME